MKVTTEIIGDSFLAMEGTQYRITLDCTYSDTLQVLAKLEQAVNLLREEIRQADNEDLKHVLFFSSLRVTTVAKAFDVAKLIDDKKLGIGKPFTLTSPVSFPAHWPEESE